MFVGCHLFGFDFAVLKYHASANAWVWDVLNYLANAVGALKYQADADAAAEGSRADSGVGTSIVPEGLASIASPHHAFLS